MHTYFHGSQIISRPMLLEHLVLHSITAMNNNKSSIQNPMVHCGQTLLEMVRVEPELGRTYGKVTLPSLPGYPLFSHYSAR